MFKTERTPNCSGVKYRLRIFPALLALPLLLLTGCSIVEVQSLGDDAVDFSQYKRFAVIEPSSFPSTADPRVNAITMRRVNRVIEEQMLINGFYKTEKEETDFLVAAHASIKGKIDISSYGYHYGYYGHRGHWGINDIALREYDEGTLIIDFIDANSDSMFWRGWATGPVSYDSDLKELSNAIAEILAQFPPL
jgi:hypothetical protein